MEQKIKILFVCTINRMRSATAHAIYQDDPRFEVQSAGTDRSANVVLTAALLDWATVIIVMEKYHLRGIRKYFPAAYKTKNIICLYINDDYDYMQPELIAILKEKFEDAYRKGLLRN